LLLVIENCITSPSDNDHIILQELYILVNIAVGNNFHKNLIMSRPRILDKICALLKYRTEEVRLGACWCIINLSWPESGSENRVRDLQTRNVGKILEDLMANDVSMDVRDRAHTALSNIKEALDVGMVVDL
jgi:armadillo repeat-containing protein 8